MISAVVSSSSSISASTSASTIFDQPVIHNTSIADTSAIIDRPLSSHSANNEHVHHHHHHHHNPNPIQHFHPQLLHQPRSDDTPNQFPQQPQIMLTRPNQFPSRVEIPYARHPYYEPTQITPDAMAHSDQSTLPSPRFWLEGEPETPPPPMVTSPFHPVNYNPHLVPYCPHYHPRTIVHMFQPTPSEPGELLTPTAAPPPPPPSSHYNYQRPTMRHETYSRTDRYQPSRVSPLIKALSGYEICLAK